MRGYNKLIGVALLLLGPLEVLAFLHAPDGRERADWLQFIGRFHSVIVHLPICLVVLAPVLEFMGRCKRWHSLLPAGGFVLGWAALSTVGAMVSGGILAYSGGYAGELVREHMWGGVYLSLVCGLALALRGAGLSAKVHSVEPENFDGMKRSLEARKRVQAPGGKLSIADSLMAPMPGAIVFELARALLAPGLAVSDTELEQAVAFAARDLKLVVEPGGAAALAAVLAGKLDTRGRTVALVLSGGNADPR